MGYSIRVAAQMPDRANDFLCVMDFDTKEEFDQVKKLCDNKKRVGLFGSLVKPIRTDTAEHFCQDLFFPSLIHCALKLHNTALKVICSIAFTAVDVMTLPIRALTAIPRYFKNGAHPKESHPFYKYLKAHGLDEKHLSAGHVYLEMRWPQRTKVVDMVSEVERQEEHTIVLGKTFNFVELPETASPNEDHQGWIGKNAVKLPYHI
jgi:hypothetical protein